MDMRKNYSIRCLWGGRPAAVEGRKFNFIVESGKIFMLLLLLKGKARQGSKQKGPQRTGETVSNFRRTSAPATTLKKPQSAGALNRNGLTQKSSLVLYN